MTKKIEIEATVLTVNSQEYRKGKAKETGKDYEMKQEVYVELFDEKYGKAEPVKMIINDYSEDKVGKKSKEELAKIVETISAEFRFKDIVAVEVKGNKTLFVDLGNITLI